jgi:superfamily II DNA or RNA helicase
MDPNELEDETLEPTLDVETSPMMEPASKLAREAPASATPPPRYWRAQSLAEALHRDFEKAQQTRDFSATRNGFYVLARYYGRTMAILRHALSERQELLLRTALRNLISLHQPMHHMHDIAPTHVPLVLTLGKETRKKVIEDLIYEVLHEAMVALDLPSITRRVNELHVLANARQPVVQEHLDNLVSNGHVERQNGGYVRTNRPYSTINLDRASLQALLGPKFYQDFDRGGFHGLVDIPSRKQVFETFLTGLTGFRRETAHLFVAAVQELIGPPSVAPELRGGQHADLIGSLYPRPYQRDAYVIFRGYGYQGELIEAPTGSGKTMIGMMCIQDWLRALSPGESILVLVPTVNYQQQWVGELCYKPIGLRLSPDAIYTGTPLSLEEERRDSGVSPTVLVMTYTALAQTGSGAGKGGFDQISIETFLQGNDIQYVILDEVHKVADDLHSVSADVTRLLTKWLRDGSLRGVIGFSGTATAYRHRLGKLGLQLVYAMPAADLIAYGFVAPFAELGVTFAYSDREQEVRRLLQEYKALLREFIALVGSDALRKRFAELPMEERLFVVRDILRMDTGQKDRIEALTKRLEAWEGGGELTLNDLSIITILQIVNNWSDEALVASTVKEMPQEEQQERSESFKKLLVKIERIRDEMKGYIYHPETVRRLEASRLGYGFDGEAIRRLPAEVASMSHLSERVKDGLATTLAGLYNSLKTLYFRVGEGRVDCIKSIIEAERATRRVTGVIIFDTGKRIRWETGTAAPGYMGVGGVFSQMLGDRRFTPMATLSSEMYLPWEDKTPLPLQIAEFIKHKIMLDELGEVLFGLVTQGLGLTQGQLSELHDSFNDTLELYVEGLSKVRARRPGEFERKVLRRFRKALTGTDLGAAGEKLLARLSLRNSHLRKWIDTFFDYALIATTFLEAKVAELQQTNGALQKFFVVKMAQGDRKQLMYDLTARVMDAKDLPINMVIVSPWARTGWNVIKPNVLIDATATRDVTAWQQLRGRAMRAMQTWDSECYRLVMLLLGWHAGTTEESTKLSPDAAIAVEESQHEQDTVDFLDDRSANLLLSIHQEARKVKGADLQLAAETRDGLVAKIKSKKLAGLTEDDRKRLVTELMLVRNKVTHIFEMIKAYGSTSQVRHDRGTGQWRRTDSISAKHSHEYSVNPISGRYGAGEDHAPLIYFGDPTKNLPSQLRRGLTREIRDRDSLIVGGWLSAVTSGMGEPVAIDPAT